MKKLSRTGGAAKARIQKQFPRILSGTQQNVISVSKLAWGYCLALIDRFAVFSTRFTPDLVADMVKQADDANALPSKEQRANAKRTAHVELIEANDAVCLQWQTLKRYILQAYPKNLVKIKLDAAGYLHYRHAKGGRWENTLSLAKDAKEFMTAFATDLEANENMPKDFPADFGVVVAVFERERNRFVGDTQSAKEGTNSKDKAIYEVELELSKLLSAGKVIFDKDPVNLKKFTYDDLIKEVRGNEPSGVKGYLYNATDGQPVSGVVVSASGYSTASDEMGKFELRMASGTYDVLFEKPGFEPLLLEGRVVKVGVMGRYNANLQAVQPGAASETGKQAADGSASSSNETDMMQPSAGG